LTDINCVLWPSAKQNHAFLLLFPEKEDSYSTNYVSGGAEPPGKASSRFELRKGLLRSRTNAFCFFFWKKKDTITPIDSLVVENLTKLFLFLGARPQTPWVGFAEV
jgi:hypothetical protein